MTDDQRAAWRKALAANAKATRNSHVRPTIVHAQSYLRLRRAA